MLVIIIISEISSIIFLEVQLHTFANCMEAPLQEGWENLIEEVRNVLETTFLEYVQFNKQYTVISQFNENE